MINNIQENELEIKDSGKKKVKAKKKSGGPKLFWTSFLFAFLAFTIVLTPAMGIFASALDIQLFNKAEEDGEEQETLEEQMDVLIPSNSPFYEAFGEKKRVNVLLLGVNGGMTDTIMLVSFDTEAKHVDIISVPRDTYYYREGYDGAAEKKINAAYRREPVNTAKAVSEVLLNMPINYYAVIEYDGIEKIVESLGGIKVDIPFDMDYEDPYDKPPLKIHFKKGEQVLDGKDAVKFLRYRKDNKKGYGYVEGDVGRIKAQQEFVKTAFKQALGFELPKVAKTVIENVESDMPLKTILSLASKAVGISGEDITTYTIPGEFESEPPYYVHPDSAGIEEMIKEIYMIKPVEETTGGAITDSTTD